MAVCSQDRKNTKVHSSKLSGHEVKPKMYEVKQNRSESKLTLYLNVCKKYRVLRFMPSWAMKDFFFSSTMNLKS